MKEKEEGVVKEAVKEPTEAEKRKLQHEQEKQERAMRKRAADELVDYKKRIRSSNEVKRLQVEELELNIAYYKNKKEWMDLAPAMEELEAKEKAIQEEVQAQRRKEFEEQQKALKKTGDDKPDTPKLISVGGGKPRDKK